MYRIQLNELESTKPTTDNIQAFHDWIWKYKRVCYKLRMYDRAEIAMRTAVVINPRSPENHAQLSLMLGYQGKYVEAIQEAEVAKMLGSGDVLYAESLVCQWLAAMGKRQLAIERFKKILVPLEGPKYYIYYCCKSAIYAQLDDAETVRDAIKIAIQNRDHKSCIECEETLDKYRGSDWFLELMGNTVKLPQ